MSESEIAFPNLDYAYVSAFFKSKPVINYEGFLTFGSTDAEGQKQGTWRSYDKNGMLRRTRSYNNGLKHGPEREYDADGNKRHESYYKYNDKHGTECKW